MTPFDHLGNDNLTFARFKAYQDLSHKDISELFDVDIATSRAWTDGAPTPEATRIAKIAHAIANKVRSDGFTDSERQQYAKQYELREEALAAAKNEIRFLAAQNELLRSSPLNRLFCFLRSLRRTQSAD